MNFEVIYYVLTVFFLTLAPALKVEAEWGIKLPNESFTTIINLINPIKIIYQKKIFVKRSGLMIKWSSWRKKNTNQ